MISIPEILEKLWGAATFVTAPLAAIPDRVLVYASVLFCCLSAMAMAFYVHKKFSKATNALAVFSSEWQVAESEFLRVVDVAQQKMSALSAQHAPVAPQSGRADKTSFSLTHNGGDLPHQVAAMARRGLKTAEIGATLGLGEADVNVLFGMHRVTQGKK